VPCLDRRETRLIHEHWRVYRKGHHPQRDLSIAGGNFSPIQGLRQALQAIHHFIVNFDRGALIETKPRMRREGAKRIGIWRKTRCRRQNKPSLAARHDLAIQDLPSRRTRVFGRPPPTSAEPRNNRSRWCRRGCPRSIASAASRRASSEDSSSGRSIIARPGTNRSGPAGSGPNSRSPVRSSPATAKNSAMPHF